MPKTLRSLHRFALSAALAGTALGPWVPPAHADLRIGGPTEIRVLYDNSGSMYPGYTPAGNGGRIASGARFFVEYPEFRRWLGDFIARQSVLDGSFVSFWISTSGNQFLPGDVRQVHPRVPLGDFNLEAALRNWPVPGDMTYLVESLDQASRGFEGILWLITDNVVETRQGEPNREVVRFFEALREEPRYRSVHLYKYPFRDPASGRSSVLAIYGIVVSSREVNREVLVHYDETFYGDVRVMEEGGESGYLKLKDLEINTIRLEPNLEADIKDAGKKGVFKESDQVALRLRGIIRSRLTQHSVIEGRYKLIPASDFEPEEWARKELGLQKIPREGFQAVTGDLKEPIPPSGSRNLDEMIPSLQPIRLSPGNFGAWLRLALQGARVEYEGTVQMQFEDVKVRLERDRMAGIFGIDQASSIFDFQDVQSISVMPSTAVVHFTLRTGEGRSALLLLVAALLLLPLCGTVWFLGRTQSYSVHLSGSPARTVRLRRLGGYEVLHEGARLGRLTRGLLGGHEFLPATGSVAVTVTPTRQVDVFEVRFRDAGSHQLTIEPIGQQAGEAQTVRTGTKIQRPPRENTAPPPGPASGGGNRPPSPPAPSPPGAAPRVRPQIKRP